MFTEFVNLTSEYLMGNVDYRRWNGTKPPRIRQRGAQSGSNELVTIYGSDGLTESYVKKGISRMIVDITQTGSTLRRLGLEIVDDIMSSEACLYASPRLSPDKLKKLGEIARNLEGVVEARKKYYVVFDSPENSVLGIANYLQENSLFADEPTIIPGKNYSQFSILVPRSIWPKVSAELKGVGAKSMMRYSPEQVIK